MRGPASFDNARARFAPAAHLALAWCFLGCLCVTGCSSPSARDAQGANRAGDMQLDADERGLVDGMTPEDWMQTSLGDDTQVAQAASRKDGSRNEEWTEGGRGGPGALFGGGQDSDDDDDAPRGSGKIFDEMRVDDSVRSQEAKELVRQSETLKLAGELRRAEGILERAVKLDPQNTEAERALDEVRQLLGETAVGSVARDFFATEKLARDMARTEIRRSISRGLTYEENGDFDRALQLYKNAIEMIKAEPFDLGLDKELQKTLVYQKRAENDRKRSEETNLAEQREKAREIARNDINNNLDYIENQIRELRRRGIMAYDDKSFKRAAEYYAQILELNPNDADARGLLAMSKERDYIHTVDRLMRLAVENYEKAVIGVEESSIVYEEIFRYPEKDEWIRLAPRVVTIADFAAGRQGVAEKDVRRRLEVPYSFGVPEATPLGEVMAELHTLTGINFFFRAGEDGGAADAEIQFDRLEQPVPLKSLLRLILERAGEDYGYIIKEEGIIQYGPQSSLQGDFIFWSYEISDLIRAKPDFRAPGIALDELAGKDSSGGASDIDIGGDDDDSIAGTSIPVEDLLKIIAKELRPGEDVEEIEGVSVLGGKLSARLPLEDHLKLARILDRFRRSTGMMVTVESRFLDIQDNVLEEIGVNMGGTQSNLPQTIPDADGNGTALAPGFYFIDAQQQFDLRSATIGTFSNPLGSQVNPFNTSSSGGGAYQLNVLDAERFQLEAILTAVAKNQEIRRLNSPRVTAFNTQTAHTLVVEQAAYIQDLEVNQTGVIPVINPVIGVLNTGSILELRPTISHDQKYVTLEIQPTLAEEIGRDVAVLNLSGNFTVVPVQLPILSVTKIKTTVSVPDGGTVLVGGLKREISQKQSIGLPFFRHIPIVNLLFGRQGNATMRSNLFVLLNAHITIVHEEEEKLFGGAEL